MVCAPNNQIYYTKRKKGVDRVIAARLRSNEVTERPIYKQVARILQLQVALKPDDFKETEHTLFILDIESVFTELKITGDFDTILEDISCKTLRQVILPGVDSLISSLSLISYHQIIMSFSSVTYLKLNQPDIKKHKIQLPETYNINS